MIAPRLIGHVLLWVGFLSATFVAVRRTELPGEPWATIYWPAYAAGLAVAIAGVVQLRRTKRRSRTAGDEQAGNVNEMAAALERLLANVQSCFSESDHSSVYEVHHLIDERLADDLATFADRRSTLIDAFGLDQYALVMTEFALAERTINRMWSASADGYVDEVSACQQRAVAHLNAAIARLSAARAGAARTAAS